MHAILLRDHAAAKGESVISNTSDAVENEAITLPTMPSGVTTAFSLFHSRDEPVDRYDFGAAPAPGR